MILREGGQEKNAAWEAEMQHSLGIIHSFIHSFTDKAPINTSMIVVFELWRQILVSVSLGERSTVSKGSKESMVEGRLA